MAKKVDYAWSVFALTFLNKTIRFFYRLLFQDKDIITDRDTLKYWQNKIFYIISVSFLICGAPIMFFGAYMFYIAGLTVFAVVEALMYFIIALFITRKSVKIFYRKLFIVLEMYVIGLLLISTTGLMGGGMVCIFFSLILAGCLLEKKQIIQVTVINLIVFIFISVMLYKGLMNEAIFGGNFDV